MLRGFAMPRGFSVRRAQTLALSTQLTGIALTLTTGILLARSLGPEGRGVYALVVAASTLAVTLGDRGLANSLLFISGGHNSKITVTQALAWRSFLAAIPVSVSLGLAVWLAASILLPIRETSIALVGGLVTLVCVLSGQFVKLVTAVLVGNRSFGWANGLRLSLGMVHLPTLVALHVGGGVSVVGACLSLGAANLVTAIVAVTKLGLSAASRSEFEWGALKSRARANSLSSIQPLDGMQADIVLLGMMSSAAATGIYGVGTSVANALRPFGTALGQPLQVAIRDASPQTGEAARYIARVLGRLLPTLLLGAAALAVAMPWAVPIVYGDEFRGAVSVAAIACFTAAGAIARLLMYEACRGFGLGRLASKGELVGFLVFALASPLAFAWGAVGMATALLLGTFATFVPVATWLIGAHKE